MKFTKSDALKVGNKLEINWKLIPFDQFYIGMNVELEHGTINRKTNITNNDPMMTGKIAWIHIIEKKNYYTKLRRYVDPGS